jgi:hypothetical protein
MTYRVEAARVNQKVVDDYFRGSFALDGSMYENWQEFTQDAISELAALNESIAMFGLVRLSAAAADGDWLESAANNYGWALAQVSAGKKISRAQIFEIIDLGVEALAAVRLQNGSATVVTVAMALRGFMEGGLRTAEAQARAALDKLKLLRVALEEAKKKRTESIAGGIIDGLITIAVILQPELIVLCGIKAAVGQKFIDDALGGSKSSAAWDTASTVSTDTSIGQSTLETFSFLMPAKAVPFIKVAGKPLAVVGLAFDVNEIYAAVKHVDAIRNAIDALMPKLAALKNQVEALQPQVRHLREQTRKVRQEVERLRAEAEVHSIECRQLAARVGYSTSSPVRWRLE